MEPQWTYKGYQLKVWLDYEEDNIKAFHEYKSNKPGSDWEIADITPYDQSNSVLELFIDAGCPPRREWERENGITVSGNWDKKSLCKLIAESEDLVV